MAKILSSSIRVEGSQVSGIDGETSTFMDSIDLIGGYDTSMAFYPKWFYTVLVREKENHDRWAIVQVPSKRWINDLKESRWEIMQVISKDIG